MKPAVAYHEQLLGFEVVTGGSARKKRRRQNVEAPWASSRSSEASCGATTLDASPIERMAGG